MPAGQALEAQQYQVDQKNQIILEMIRDRCNRQSTRKIARESGIDPANLSHVLNGKRRLTALMRAKLEPLKGYRYFQIVIAQSLPFFSFTKKAALIKGPFLFIFLSKKFSIILVEFELCRLMRKNRFSQKCGQNSSFLGLSLYPVLTFN